jgi:hypothetical protein
MISQPRRGGKPEDLRVHLEEAAGISKYKERRKETESRMRHDARKPRPPERPARRSRQAAQIEAEHRQDALRLAETAIMDWQSRWDAYARDSGESARAAEVERTRLNFLDKQSLDASSRLTQLEDERRKMDVASLRRRRRNAADAPGRDDRRRSSSSR